MSGNQPEKRKRENKMAFPISLSVRSSSIMATTAFWRRPSNSKKGPLPEIFGNFYYYGPTKNYTRTSENLKSNAANLTKRIT